MLIILSFVFLLCSGGLHSQNIGVLHFKVSSDDSKYNYLSDVIRSIITTKVGLSSDLHVVPLKEMAKTLKNLNIDPAKTTITDDELTQIKNRLDLHYVLTGEVKITDVYIKLKGKLINFSTGEVIKQIYQSRKDFNNLYNMSNKLANYLLDKVARMSDIPSPDTITGKSNDVDILFLYNSGSRIYDQLKVLKDNLYNIVENIRILNPCPRVRIAIVDANPIVKNVPVILQFTDDIEKLEEFLTKSIKLTEKPGMEVNEEYSLLYALQNVDWTVSNHRERFLFLIGSKSSDFPKKVKSDEVIDLAKLLGVRIYPISGFNFYKERSDVYQLYAEHTDGIFNDLTYKVSYRIDGKGRSHFAVKRNQLYMFKLTGTGREWQLPHYLNNERNVVDLSFGDRLTKNDKLVNKHDAITSFLEKRGLNVVINEYEKPVEFDNNIDSIVINEIKRKYNFEVEKNNEYVRLYLKDNDGYHFYVSVANRKACLYIRDNIRIGSEITIGGQIIPTTPYDILYEHDNQLIPIQINFFFNSPSIMIYTKNDEKQKYISPYLILSVNKIKTNPYNYRNFGIFDIKRWFINCRVLKVEFRKTES